MNCANGDQPVREVSIEVEIWEHLPDHWNITTEVRTGWRHFDNMILCDPDGDETMRAAVPTTETKPNHDNN